MPLNQNTNIHAMCKHYGHEWSKSDILSARQKAGYRVDICKRNDCDAARRVWEGV